eukprot:PhF_6_TR19930/c0_g1_i2/m.28996
MHQPSTIYYLLQFEFKKIILSIMQCSPFAYVPSENHEPIEFDSIIPLGRGGYGEVFKVHSNSSGQTAALKKFNQKYKEQVGVCGSILREVTTLTSIPPHPNVIKVHTISHNVSTGDIGMVMDFCDLGDLSYYLGKMRSSRQAIPLIMVKKCMHQLLLGLDHIHSHGVMHRDIKPCNILLRTEGETLVVCDFGSARFIPPEHDQQCLTPVVTTLWYRAPEVLFRNDVYTSKVDMWSAGCVFGEMLNGNVLFPGENVLDQMFRVTEVIGTPSYGLHPDETFRCFVEKLPQWNPLGFTNAFPTLQRLQQQYDRAGEVSKALDLLEKLLVWDPNVRLDARTALTHPYFTAV